MQDPICAMKILRRPKFRVPNRNLVRPKLRAARRREYGDMAYPIDSQFASAAGGLFTAHATRSGRNSALVGAAVAVQLHERFSMYVCYDGRPGPGN
jgi:uncharacterized protein with beta-barrel porin domain